MMKVLPVLLVSLSSTFAFVQPGRSFSRPHFELRRNDEAVLSPGGGSSDVMQHDVEENNSIFGFTSSFSQEQFLQDMDEQKQELDSLSHQYAALHDLNLLPAPANDYLESVTRLSRLADESTAKYNPELILLGFQEKKIQNKLSKSSTRGTLNESSKAFMLLAVAIAATTLATNSPIVIEQLSTFDIPSSLLKFDGLPTMPTSFHNLGAAPMNSFHLPPMNSDEWIDPLRANIVTMKESVMAQTSQALDAIKGTKTTVFSGLYDWWNVAKESMTDQVDSLHAQVEGGLATAKDLQTSTTFALQDAMQDNTVLLKTSLAEQTSAAEATVLDMQTTAQEELTRMADNTKVGLFTFMDHLRAAVEGAQYTLPRVAVPEILPRVDGTTTTFSTLAKQIQAAASIELPHMLVLPASAADEPREALAAFDIYRSSAAIEEFFRNR
mmetsp:Transcript_19519/g.32404  ORF Transcript_19519/g.32404 Transcript_19519/m.32404 type:complete len:439 (-) Transcript_19519:485-1801(-)|eukprot:CAMPEP_0119004604 /NCGR_PEP_ID=MMETSP1176-20130426/1241_1 /TAXON_ID=265551 /ORGANISM="Synedropsis recta cf, Strain CCMP1620" /LENGTH=438 /DNA_ID=CAMNT_0006956331 /DNA_START=25 /DNA_END=1341 /DNA_ORIENTATION=-